MSYVVKKGDTLSAIASKLGVSLAALEKANPMKNFNRVSIGQSLNVPGSSGTAAAVAPAADTPGLLQQASDQYGPLAQTLNSIPELRDMLQTAINKQWSPAYLQSYFEGTPWYQSHSDTARSALLTAAADPAVWQQQLANAGQLVAETANGLGVTVDNNAIASQYLMQGWTQQQLSDYIGQNGAWQYSANGAMVGSAAQAETKLKQLAQDYGIPATDAYVQGQVRNIVAGKDSIDGATQQYIQQAKAKYPQFAAQIDAGQTIRDIADPYMAQMSKTLEMPQTAITLDNTLVQKGLSQTDPTKGTQTSMPMWQFDQLLKADPRYDHTQQARTDAYTTLTQIGKDFGFTGGGGNAP